MHRLRLVKLKCTAASRGTDINGALRYLIEMPPWPATSRDADED